MGDVGRETLDRVDAQPQRLGHRAQRIVEVADLVAPLAEVGNLRPALAGQPDLVGGARQAHDRLGDGAGQVERQQHGDAERGRGDGQHVVADFAQRGGDGAIVARQEEGAQHLLVTLDRHRGAEQQPPLSGAAHGGRVEAAQGAGRLGKIAQGRDRLLDIFGIVVDAGHLARDPVADALADAVFGFGFDGHFGGR